MSLKQVMVCSVAVLLLVPLLLVAQEATPTPTPLPTPTLPLFPTPVSMMTFPIEIGQTIVERFTDANALLAYQFQGQAAQIVDIVLQNTNNNGSAACLTLNDAGVTPLAYSNSEYGADGPRAVIRFFTLPGDNQYTISVNACSTIGEFRLTLFAPPAETIDFNRVITGGLTEPERGVVYRIEGQSGDLVTVGFEATFFSAIVDISCGDSVRCGTYSANAFNGYSANNNALTLPADAPYLVTVRTEDTIGEFRLAVNRLTPASIAYGDVVQAEFDGSVTVLQYKFTGTVGDWFNIRAESNGTLDTRLTLMSDGGLVTQDDDSANGLDPEILNQLVYAPGTYTIILEPAALGEVGTVTLRLERTLPAALDQGSQTVVLTRKQTTAVASFSGTAGEQVRVTTRVIVGSKASPQLDIRQNLQSLVNSYATGSDVFSVEFTVPNSGEVVVFVTGSPGTVELSLERLGQAG